MTMTRQHILIKGNKEGLQFLMDEHCSYQELLEELEQKIRVSHARFLQGPLTHVSLYFGNRYLGPEEKERIIRLIEQAGNLIVKEVYTDVLSKEEVEGLLEKKSLKIEVGIVRSGQILESEQDILVLGDVNPGGWVVSHGNIYVLGSLKGIAHAGKNGDKGKIIAASLFKPMQLRIADVIVEEFPIREEGEEMKFAYLEDGLIKLARIQLLKQLRPHHIEEARRNR